MEEMRFDASADELGVWLAEADELLQLLDEDVVRLEQEGGVPELLQEIFRAAHTLKGSSASIGHRRMAELTHLMESLLDLLRKGRRQVETAIIDVLLECLDALRVLRQEVAESRRSDFDLSPLISRLQQVIEVSPASETVDGAASVCPGTTAKDEAAAFQAEGKEVFHVAADVDRGSLMPAVRGMQLLVELGEVGQVIWSRPTSAQIENEDVGNHFEVVIASWEGKARLESILAGIPELVSWKITPYFPPEAFPAVGEASTPVPLVDERREDQGPQKVGLKEDRRVVNLGPGARGKSPEEMLRLAGRKLSTTVRIDVARLDNLMNLVGELVIDRTRLNQLTSQLGEKYGDSNLLEDLAQVSLHLERITNELQNEVMKSRLLPMENVFSRFPRLVRDLAQKAGKQVNLVIEGQETELDRSVIEEIGDPLVHLLRNAVDHGIETVEARLAAGKPEVGTVRLGARHEENQIVITVEDDGRGIDPQKVKSAAVEKGLISRESADRLGERECLDLIFLAGLSTAQKVSEVSGRGVGMDVVRTNIERLNGSISLDTALGRGTKFTIRLPLTLAIVQALLVSVSGQIFALPVLSVTEILPIRVSEVKMVNQRPAVQLRGEVLPLLHLDEALGMSGDGQPARVRKYAVCVRYGGRPVGLVVDGLVGEQEIVIKPLNSLFADAVGVSGVTILGDGRVAPIVDAASLVKAYTEERLSLGLASA